MPLNTRQLILQRIRALGSASAADIAQTLNLTQAAVRYHLTTLIQTNEIEVAAEKIAADHPGHPARVYRLARAHAPHNLAELSSALLTAAEQNASQPDWITAVANQLARGFSPPNALARRLNATMGHLKARNYQPSWEARPHGPRIRLDNCPYAAILADHPRLCQVDAHLLSILTNGKVDQRARIDFTSTQRTFCLFDIRLSSPSPTEAMTPPQAPDAEDSFPN